ncbi:MAG: hypothetical protein KDC95_12390 [Planctomycetes bacterium]|nr:hypothetical protein [Planctomycetota bacterium]
MHGIESAVYDLARQRFLINGDVEWDGTTLAKSPERIPITPVAMAYDLARRQTVAFGLFATENSETRTFDGATWTLRQPTTQPPHRHITSLAYDATRQRVVLFGGIAYSNYLSDTWVWDGTTWSEVKPATSPAGRTLHSMAFDSSRSRVVLFGGNDGSNTLSDTWEWDGTNWNQQRPTTSPTAVVDPSMTYDARSGEILLFGKPFYNGTAELWAYKAGSWSKYAPKLQPNPDSFLLGFDQRRQRTTLFGKGPDSGFTIWEWDGVDWSLRRQPDINIVTKSGHGHAFDSTRSAHVIFGGMDVGGMGHDDTFELLGDAWTKPQITTRPSARLAPAMAYDSARQRTVLFGGRLGIGSLPMADTWERIGGTNWIQRSPTTSPTAVTDHGMIYDSNRNRTVLFGGYTSMGSLYFPATPSNETWEYDGTNWAQITTPSKPPARADFGMALDPVRNRVVVFGGYDGRSHLADTWEYDGSSWRLFTPPTSPLARSGCAMAFDPSRGRVVLHGGGYGTVVKYRWLDDTWEWDGASWRQIITSGERVSGEFVMAYDPSASSLVMIGSFGSVHRLGVVATVAPRGSGCAGTGAGPTLTANAPSIGSERLSYDVLNSQPSMPCIHAVSPASMNLSLGSGCTLYVAPPILTSGTVTNASGFAELGFALPFDPTLRGVSYHTQAFVLDAASPVLGLAFTNAVQTVIGN